jgi:hypothetical protein
MPCGKDTGSSSRSPSSTWTLTASNRKRRCSTCRSRQQLQRLSRAPSAAISHRRYPPFGGVGTGTRDMRFVLHGC